MELVKGIAKQVMVVLFSLLTTFSANASELKPLKLVAIDLPFVHEHLSGIVERAYERINQPISIDYNSTIRSQQLSDNGSYDGDLVRAELFKKLFKNLTAVDVSLGTLEVFLACASHVEVCENTVLEQSHKTLVILPGSHLLNAAVKEKQINLITIPHIHNLTEMLKRGRVDFTLVVKHRELKQWISNIEGLKVANKPFYTSGAFHFIHKRHQPIIAELEAAIRQEYQLAIKDD